MIRHSLTILIFIFSSYCIASPTTNEELSQWEKTKLNVAAITALDSKFMNSVGVFRGSEYYRENSFLEIKGNANSDIKEYEVVHIQGDLNASIQLHGHSELIISGDVNKNARIYINDIARIYIGGSMLGSVIANSSFQLNIAGNLSGHVLTGNPTSKIIVLGDLTGMVQPNKGDGALVSITVHGHTDIEKIKKIYSNDYTEIIGAFKYSNDKPGTYHPKAPFQNYYTILNSRE